MFTEKEKEKIENIIYDRGFLIDWENSGNFIERTTGGNQLKNPINIETGERKNILYENEIIHFRNFKSLINRKNIGENIVKIVIIISNIAMSVFVMSRDPSFFETELEIFLDYLLLTKLCDLVDGLSWLILPFFVNEIDCDIEINKLDDMTIFLPVKKYQNTNFIIGVLMMFTKIIFFIAIFSRYFASTSLQSPTLSCEQFLAEYCNNCTESSG